MTRGTLDRLLRYVKVDTQANEASRSSPSTPGQLQLLTILRDELVEMGAADVSLDEHGYVMATIPSTVPEEMVPTIGFLAHVDTSPEMSGRDVKPIVHRAYNGADIAFPDDPSLVLRAADHPDLHDCLGHDIVTASGQTLLGADDKAGVAEIMTAAEYMLTHPEWPHGRVRVAFTPDEEIGRGTAHFDVSAFGASVAYTMDGGARGELEYESFSADALTVVFRGFNTHPGYAKGRMINAVRAAAAFVAALPQDRLSPETTEGYDGYVHPYVIDGGVEQVRVRVLLRDFDTRKLAEHRAVVEGAVRAAAERVDGIQFEVSVEESYRNMREVIERHPRAIAAAAEAIRRAGLDPVVKPIRGGTDGSRLSFMGLPTPNLFAGEHNFHSRLEWVSAQDMDKAGEVIVHLSRIWAGSQ
jgi:tripeptide aminopeptidase